MEYISTGSWRRSTAGRPPRAAAAEPVPHLDGEVTIISAMQWTGNAGSRRQQRRRGCRRPVGVEAEKKINTGDLKMSMGRADGTRS